MGLQSEKNIIQKLSKFPLCTQNILWRLPIFGHQKIMGIAQYSTTNCGIQLKVFFCVSDKVLADHIPLFFYWFLISSSKIISKPEHIVDNISQKDFFHSGWAGRKKATLWWNILLFLFVFLRYAISFSYLVVSWKLNICKCYVKCALSLLKETQGRSSVFPVIAIDGLREEPWLFPVPLCKQCSRGGNY